MTILEEAYVPVIQAHELVQQYFATYLPAEEVDHAVWMFERSYPLEEATDWLHESSKDPVWNRLIIGLRCGQLLPRPARRLLEDYAYLEQEQLQLLCLDTKNSVLRREVVFQGTINSCPAQPREIIKLALMTVTARIVIVHNHPSGDVTPSTKDIEFTKRLQLACELMGMPLLDSFIVGVNDYYSFAEQGLINCNTDSQ
ncbi:JAB domain-containing protein [Lactiplantibacillus pentosus]|uniref:JAB domain-containing protein n=1 Tax=Lactiplantibacillus pentosus TaxID=1589 RepID=A0AAW8VT44_LACPE|nr:JAB domain-containing protein [Lactiplantibacillus pentosus]MBU7473151.1 DNA repair protein [Lactiplantibacillus pentosus]MBU7528781.1 DNA repair protein [Lactiplantibacillus pentosus]MDT6988757.1 JAB domain-containing protein [Lactiplantibacillus pentosus]